MMILGFTPPGDMHSHELANFELDFGDCPTPRIGEQLFIEDVNCVVTGITTGFYRYEKRPSGTLPQPDYLIYLSVTQRDQIGTSRYLKCLKVSLAECPNVSKLQITNYLINLANGRLQG